MGCDIVPRFLTTVIREGEYPLGREVCDDTEVALGEGVSHQWKNVITDEWMNGQGKLIIGEVLNHFPVALLMREEAQ